MNLALAVALAIAQASTPRVIVVDPGFEIAGHRIHDVDGDGRSEFVVLGCDGRVRSFRPLSEGPAKAHGSAQLAAPKRSLVGLASWGGKTYLIAETPNGTQAYALDSDGVVAASAAAWIPRGRFTLRVPAPTFSPIVQDVNSDGVNDVLVPTLAGVELWLASMAPGESAPSFRKAATVSVDIDRGADHEFEALSDSLADTLTIPGLHTADVNGDGRPDLVVEQGRRRAWHLQRADASFPIEADVSLDLSTFQDTTPAAELRLGSTLSGGERASFASRDLDGDLIPDYVIAHRRKVWVFRGGKNGPQFKEPSAILKTAEDITALIVHPLDDDDLADLLLVKVQVPTLATLLRGLFGEWDVRIRALGYRNTGAGRFETSPGLSNDLSLRLPGIVGLVKNPEKLLERFEDVGARFRGGARGDVDGDGADDVMLVTSDDKALEVWFGRPEDASRDREKERKLLRLLFDEQDAVWDVDRMLGALGSLADRQLALATGDRPADQLVPLRDPAEAVLRGVECADLDGDGARELILSYRKAGDSHSGWFEVTIFGRRK